MIDDSFIFEKIADLRLFEAHADMSTSHKTCSNVSWYLVLDQYYEIISLWYSGLNIHWWQQKKSSTFSLICTKCKVIKPFY